MQPDNSPGDHTMNKDQAKGKWDQIKGKAKKVWGEVTDNEAKKAEGSANKIHGTLQEKLGDAKKTVKKELDKVNQK